MKIAVVTDDEKKISAHFGDAKYYLVLTVDDGKIVSRERREKPKRRGHHDHHGHHNHHSHHSHHNHESGHNHQHGRHSHNDHAQLAAVINDCEVVLGRGMGERMYENLKQVGVRPFITKVADIDQAVLDYAAGTLIDYPERLH